MTSLYEQMYQSLKADITDGKFQVGDRIPSETSLAEQFQVSRITSKKALEKLMNEGLVYRQRGRGTFVSEMKQPTQDVVKSRFLQPTFGLIMTSLDASFGNELVSSLIEKTKNNASVIVRVSSGSPENESKIIEELLDIGVHGISIVPAHSEHYSQEILKLVVNQFPLVLLDRSIKGIGVNSVSTNNQAAAQEGVHYLMKLGHEHIAVLMPSNYKTTSIEDRINGIVHAYAENNLMVNRDLWFSNIQSTLPQPASTRSEDVQRIKQHLQDHPDITAIFALEYNIAILSKKAIAELNLRVPEDIAIMCFDSTPFNDMEYNFTHIKQNETELGKQTILRLIEMYNGNNEIRKEYVPATLVKGSTT
ncbi:GntR family transcriptional regulator [Gracilibacillus caseinilyticus]|uniref:GntR family transcriptional regulator n=1 Tax=Gracilibacillus caseinilyticus TaxID=2932256 RepID=A0ABY4EQ58_9BACI|nr:GntR family transcriptional regulator [Gracilibacillus caseinilyticus]UOQ46583.1 GntR family transcriptional regulator [Gracilibacillus caseinilyticus]